MSKFTYFDVSASVQIDGDHIRVMSDSPLVEEYREAGHAEISFRDWWGQLPDEVRENRMEGARPGTFKDDAGDGEMLYSLESGEPLAEQEQDMVPGEEMESEEAEEEGEEMEEEIEAAE